MTAVVIVKPGHSLDEAGLIARTREHVSPFKCPKRVIFQEAMPKTATGKIQKGKLHASLAETYSA